MEAFDFARWPKNCQKPTPAHQLHRDVWNGRSLESAIEKLDQHRLVEQKSLSFPSYKREQSFQLSEAITDSAPLAPIVKR